MSESENPKRPGAILVILEKPVSIRITNVSEETNRRTNATVGTYDVTQEEWDRIFRDAEKNRGRSDLN